MTQVAQLIKVEPQPVKIADAPYPGEGIWEYDGEVYSYDSLMAEHLFHNVYGNDLANGIGDDDEAYARVIDYVWYWEKV